MYQPFPKIHAYHDTISHARRLGCAPGARAYRGTVKLHGSNAGVRVPRSGEIFPQSRNRSLTLESDNFGFAAFALTHEAAIRELADAIKRRVGLHDVTLFGEWIGPGVQKGVAIAQLPARQWVLFAAAATGLGTPVYLDLDTCGRPCAPDAGIHNVLEAEHVTISIDLTSPASCSAAMDTINAATERVENACPWAARFGLEGIGEGLVWTPAGGYDDPGLCFKSKGVKHKGEHKGPRASAPARMTAEQFATIDAFVAARVDGERVAQGIDHVRELGKPIDMTSTGAFLVWISGDIFAECQAEILAMGVDTARLHKAITAAAAQAWRAAVAEARE
jgi:hypothetical protein